MSNDNSGMLKGRGRRGRGGMMAGKDDEPREASKMMERKASEGYRRAPWSPWQMSPLLPIFPDLFLSHVTHAVRTNDRARTHFSEQNPYQIEKRPNFCAEKKKKRKQVNLYIITSGMTLLARDRKLASILSILISLFFSSEVSLLLLKRSVCTFATFVVQC